AEVDVRHQGHGDAPSAQAALHFADGFGVSRGRRGDADDLAAGLYQADGLGQCGLHVLGARRGHRLDADGLVAADGDVADLDFAGRAARVREPALAVPERLRHQHQRPAQLITWGGETRSLKEMITIRVSSTTMPTKWYAASRSGGMRRPRIHSSNTKNRRPPSSAGIGSMLAMERPALNRPVSTNSGYQKPVSTT